MNRLGNLLCLSTFGESHGIGMGGVLDGLPAGIKIDMDDVQRMIDRRRTGQSHLTSQRKESDITEIFSGISSNGITLGSPIGFLFRNTDARSRDYGELETHFRPNHADYTYQMKYGIRDARGGGRASARETVNWVMGGGLTMQWLKTLGISIEARVTYVGSVGYSNPFSNIEECPEESSFIIDEAIEKAMLQEVEKARNNQDSIGGQVSCIIRGLPAGLGSPVFGKLQARLAEAMMSLNACKSFEYGIGTEAASMRGSEALDLFNEGFSPVPFKTNKNGGILGGISTGMPVYFKISLKPTPTISRPIQMPDIEGNLKEIKVEGRHDPCVALRAPVIVEALSAIVIGDCILERYVEKNP